MKFHIMIYGCQMNYADSARIKVILQNIGWEYTQNIKEADVVIFDTCSVRQKSEDKILGIIKDIPPTTKIWITGCMIQHDLKVSNIFYVPQTKFKKGNFIGDISNPNPQIVGINKPLDADKILLQSKDEISNYVLVNYAFRPIYTNLIKKTHNLELMFRIDDIVHLPQILTQLGYDIPQIDLGTEYTNIIPTDSNQQFSSTQKTAFVPIQTGCNQFCSYCIVPYARGFQKNRSTDDILSEIKYHISHGKKEIVLLGQIVNKHNDFYHILKETLKIDELQRLRYTSPYPTFYNDDIFALHGNEPKLCPHIHMPLQSGSDAVLKKMFRGYTVEQYKEFVDKIRNLKRDISLTTDIIVGFCDETDKDFAQTLNITKYSQFDMIYIGIYSPRPGTYAAQNYQDNISKEIKRQRRDQLTKLLTDISIQNNQKEVGMQKNILITSKENGIYIGYDEKLKNVLIETDQELGIGNFVIAQITDSAVFKLKAKI